MYKWVVPIAPRGPGDRSMASPECVSAEKLRAFLLGDVPDWLARDIRRHLATCPACDALARGLDGQTDTVVSSRPASPVPEAEPPRQIGGYTLLEELGRGGMGVVFKARQTIPSRLVALKMILAGSFSEPARKARFLAEGDAIARLQHPNIVQIYEVGQHDGLPFLVLEYVAGGTLADQLRAAPLPPARAAELVEVLARAVHH